MQGGFILFVFIFLNVTSIECRVFCQDSNAGPWVPLGYTCPVVCASVLDAIDRLIMMDYKRSVKEQLGGKQNLNKRLIGYDNDYTEDIPANYYRYLRKKSSNDDENDNGIANSNDSFDISKDLQKDDKKFEKSKKNTDGVEYYDTDEYNKIENSINNVDIDNAANNGITKLLEKFDANTKQTIGTTEKINYNGKDGNKNEDKIQYNERNADVNDKLQTNHTEIDMENLKILENIKQVKGILRRSYNDNGIGKNMTKYDSNHIDREKENEKCWFLEKFKPKLLIGKVVRRKCGRRSNFDDKFVAVMTNVLNKYVDTVFRFTEEMTEILLENIFGKNTDLRNNIFDVNKLLNYLRKSVDRHRVHSHKHVITLKSKHCLTVAMPGCFCKTGFVESSGQCVKPEDCIADESYLQYLSRIVVL